MTYKNLVKVNTIVNFVDLGFCSSENKKNVYALALKERIFVGTLILLIIFSSFNLSLSFFWFWELNTLYFHEKYSSLYFDYVDNELPLVILSIFSGIAAILVILSSFLYALRKLDNPLYWQIACWFIVSLGILARPFVIFVIHKVPLEFSYNIVHSILVATIVSLAVFPALMRYLNRIKPEPGLIHVALPFSLGFFSLTLLDFLL